MNYWQRVNATDGTAQKDRFPEPLRDDYFRVDEMSFEDLLSLSTKFAAELRFFNISKAQGLTAGKNMLLAADGDWSDLFSADEIVVMAWILSTDLKQLRTTLVQRLDAGAESAASFTFELAHRINAWRTALSMVDHPSAVALHQNIGQIIQQTLAMELNQLMQYWSHARSGVDSAPWDPAALDPVWQVSRSAPLTLPDRSSVRFRSWERSFLGTTADSLLNAIAYFQSIIPQHLEASLKSERHNPAVALFIAFLKIYRRAQASLNTLTPRHRDFYYLELLKERSKPAIGDIAWFVLRADAAIREADVPAGTLFVTGKDENNRDVVFEAANDLRVTDAHVRQIYTLCLERDKLISPERELGYVTRTRIYRFPTIGGTENVWPVFGAEMKETYRGSAEDAEIGFAIASPVLHLKEGSRTLIVDLDLSDRSTTEGTAALLLSTLVDKYSDLTDAEITASLREIFGRFLLSHSDLFQGKSAADLSRMVDATAGGTPVARVRALLDAGTPARLYDVFLLEMLQHTDSVEMFFRVFGRVFRRNLLGRHSQNEERLSSEDKRHILDRATTLLTGTANEISLVQIRQLLTEARDVVFSRLLRHAFEITVTSPAGWAPVETYSITPCQETEHSGEFGLRCTLRLKPDAEPIVACDPKIHGSQWQTPLPIICFRINSLSIFYHYSLFDGMRLREALLECNVQGVRTFLAYNNEGQLDPSKPFMPFGALPTRYSYFIFGQAEIARKSIAAMQLHVEWDGLPSEYGGFRAYYDGYPHPLDNDSFEVAVAALRDGEWQPAERSKRARLKLFSSQEGEIVRRTSVLTIDDAAFLKPIPPATTDEEFVYDLRARTGFISLTLVSPDDAFGHQTHPQVLTKILTENARYKRSEPLPNPPYTPLINRITIDYTARDIVAAGDAATGNLGQKVYQLHPFGTRSVYPASAGALPQLLPEFTVDGNLFIGIEARELKGELALLFHMADDSTTNLDGSDAASFPIVWFYLASNRWRRLEPPRVLSNTTSGFQRSGVVTLNIPADINTDNTVMPPGLFWLRVGTSGVLQHFSSLYSVYTHGLKVVRQLSSDGTAGKHVRAGAVRQLRTSIAGLTEIRQIAESFGGRPAESPSQMQARISERLRHKKRAAIPWDYERLVLDEFPEVFKVKCLPNVVSTSRDPEPGHVMIVVVPAGRADTFSPRLDAVKLDRIRTFLQSVSSPAVKISVRNPSYETVQVRCMVKFRHSTLSGLVNRLNAEIVHYLSPWEPGGYEARFGWSIRSEDVQSFIRQLDFVELVTDFSILHITDEFGNYRLGDTARFFPVTLGSFQNFRKFALAVRDARDPVAAYLRERLRTDTIQMLESLGSSEISFQLAEAMLEDLNNIISEAIYDAGRFAHVVLREDTRRRLNQMSSDKDVTALNRCLLEDWGPDMFETFAARTQVIRPEYPWSIAIPASGHWISTLDNRNPITAEPTGIDEMEVVSNFIIS